MDSAISVFSRKKRAGSVSSLFGAAEKGQKFIGNDRLLYHFFDVSVLKKRLIFRYFWVFGESLDG